MKNPNYYSFLVCDHGDFQVVYVNGIELALIKEDKIELKTIKLPFEMSNKELIGRIEKILTQISLEKTDYSI